MKRPRDGLSFFFPATSRSRKVGLAGSGPSVKCGGDDDGQGQGRAGDKSEVERRWCIHRSAKCRGIHGCRNVGWALV